MEWYRNRFVFLYFSQALFSRSAFSQHTAAFQYPSGDELYNVLDTVVVQWTSNYVSPILFTWVDHGELVSEINDVPQSGNISYNLNDYSSGLSGFPAELWFDLIYDLSIAGHQGGFNGPPFNITSNAGAVPTTWVLGTSYVGSSTTGTSSPATATSIIKTAIGTSGTSLTSTRTSPAPTNTNPPSTGSSGLSMGAKAGIGIAAAAGALVLLVGAIWFIISHRRKRKLESHLTSGIPESRPEFKHEMAADRKVDPQAKSKELETEPQETLLHEPDGNGNQNPQSGSIRLELPTNGL